MGKGSADEFDDECLAELASGGTETILLAEDDRQVRKLAAQVPSQAGYRVIKAEDGDEAARKFRRYENAIDLALLDVVTCPGTGNLAQLVNTYSCAPAGSKLGAAGFGIADRRHRSDPDKGYQLPSG